MKVRLLVVHAAAIGLRFARILIFAEIILAPALEPVAFAGEGDDLGVLKEPVENHICGWLRWQ